MAVLTDADYTSLFNRLGEVARWFFLLEIRQTSTNASLRSRHYMREEFEDAFTNYQEQLVNFQSDVDALIRASTTFKNRLKIYTERVFYDLGIVLGVTTPSNVVNVAVRLIEIMNEDWEGEGSSSALAEHHTICKRTIIVDTDDISSGKIILPHDDNVGDGSLVYSLAQVTGETPTEIAEEDVINCDCTATTVAGGETFTLSGRVKKQFADFGERGAGAGPTLSAALNNGLLTNGDLETWSGVTPALGTWGVDDGTFGTEMEQESTIIHRDDFSLESNEGTADWQISQVVSLDSNTKYLVGLWVRDAAGNATGTLHIEIQDTDDIVEISVDEDAATMDIDLADLTAAWALKYFVFDTPGAVRSNWKFCLRMDTHAVEAVYIDTVQLIKMSSHNQAYWGILAGGSDFELNDKFGYGGDKVGITMEIPYIGVARTADADCTAAQITFDTADHTAEFPVGSYVQHPTHETYHIVTAVALNGGNTEVDVAPTAVSTFASLSVRAQRRGYIQAFLGRCFGIQLPSADDPTYLDATF